VSFYHMMDFQNCWTL